MALKFFNQISLHGKALANEPTFINVGMQEDCGFRAVAVGLLQNIVTHPRINADLIKLLLKEHVKYFEQQLTAQHPALIKPYDRMIHLIESKGMPELVLAMAYTLRQMVVDEWVANPERYVHCFVDKHRWKTPAMLRMPSTWLDVSSMAALAHILSMPIVIHEMYSLQVDDALQCPNRLYYQSAKYHAVTNPRINIQWHGAYYLPEVVASDLFVDLATFPLPSNYPTPPIDTLSMDVLERQLASTHKQYQQIYAERLKCMVMSGELDTDNLIEMYVQGIRPQVHDEPCQLGIDMSRQHGLSRPMLAPLKTNTMDSALMDGIARAISLGQLDIEHAFAIIDKKNIQLA